MSANDRGGPASGTITGPRVSAPRIARHIRRSVTLAGAGWRHASSPSTIGTSATVATIRGSVAAVISASPPPSDIPQSAIRSASTPSSPRA
jgi:hypothetical protein